MRPGEPSSARRFPPFDLKADIAEPATQEVAALADVSPQGSLHPRRQALAGTHAVRPAQVLVVDEVLVEVGHGADPADAEHPRGWARADPLDEPLELSSFCEPHPTSLGEPLEPPGQDEAGAGQEIVLTQHEVGGEVLGGPAREKRRSIGPEFLEQIAQRPALLRIQRKITHIPIVAPMSAAMTGGRM